jgi:hypothetical protein
VFAHAALSFARVSVTDGLGDGTMRSGGFGAVVLGDVLFGRRPPDGLLDGGQNRCEDGVSTGPHHEFVEFVIARAVGRDTAFGDLDDGAPFGWEPGNARGGAVVAAAVARDLRTGRLRRRGVYRTPQVGQPHRHVVRLGYGNRTPYVTVHVVRPDGVVASRELWDAPYCSEVHDMWLTPEWMALPFEGFVFDPDRIDRGLPVHGWDPELPIMLALVPRDDVEHGEIR